MRWCKWMCNFFPIENLFIRWTETSTLYLRFRRECDGHSAHLQVEQLIKCKSKSEIRIRTAISRYAVTCLCPIRFHCISAQRHSNDLLFAREKKYINDFVVSVWNDVMRKKNRWKVCNEARTHYINELMAEMHSSLMGRTTNWTLVTIVWISFVGVRRHRSTDGRHHGLLAVQRTKRKACGLINFTLTVCSGRPFLPFVHTPICIFPRFRATCIAHIKCHSRFCLVCAVCASRPCTF